MHEGQWSFELFERHAELEQIQRGLDSALRGQGRIILMRGEPGIGKSRLALESGFRAAHLGFRVLRSAGGELEHELPYGVIRQLFEPILQTLPADIRADVLSGAAEVSRRVLWADGGSGFLPEIPLYTAVHGLFWLCSNLSSHGPLLMIVDDMHWADLPSLHVLSHIGRRIRDLPVLLLLGRRPRNAGSNQGLDAFGDGIELETLRLAPLTPAGTCAMVQTIFGRSPDAEFAQSAHEATGGNPYLLRQLLESAQSEGLLPVAEQAPRLTRLRVESVAEWLLTRLSRQDGDAVRVARAVALLGPYASATRVAKLSDLNPAKVVRCQAQLITESILRADDPLVFVHPLVRTAVLDDPEFTDKPGFHRRAVTILRDSGAGIADLTPHLLASPQENDPMVAELLKEAAHLAMATGAPASAVTCLSRALAGFPHPAERSSLLVERGRALAMDNRPIEAEESFRKALSLVVDVDSQVRIRLVFSGVLMMSGRASQAAEVLSHVDDRTAHADENLYRLAGLASVLAGITALRSPLEWRWRLDELVDDRNHPEDQDRLITACRSFVASLTGDLSANRIAQLSTQAADGPFPPEYRWWIVNFASASLAISGFGSESLTVLDRGIQDARDEANTTELRYLYVLRSHTAHYFGKLLEAEADARTAHNLLDEQPQDASIVTAVLVNALLDQGKAEKAQKVLDQHVPSRQRRMENLLDHFLLLARARLHLELGNHHDALNDALLCGRSLESAGVLNPCFAHWRQLAAAAYAGLNRTKEALEIASAEVELAREFGVNRGLGIALRTRGMVSRGEQGLRYFEESVQVLARSDAHLEYARSLVELGSALRRNGQRKEAASWLRQGLDVAASIGALGIVQRAREELKAAGARPRSNRIQGIDSLTASELRVARLAAGGQSNRQIAQGLYVTLRTVETHLTRAYRKLGVESRDKLAQTLTTLDSDG